MVKGYTNFYRMRSYRRSLKVERKIKITLMFTDDELPTFTEGREKRNIITPSFTNDELPTFTEGRKKITIIDVHCR